MAAFAALLLVCACSGPPAAPSPVPTGNGNISEPADTGPAVLVGSGDIAWCGVPGSEMTARLLDRIGGTVFTTGDNTYMTGSDENYRDCYAPTWGRHRERTRPAAGNHDYESPNAAPYFRYFGANAGPAGLGYYSYDLGAWHVVVLNSEVDASAGSPQVQWLRADLAARNTRCAVAYWHRPLFSSGPNADNGDMRELWTALYQSGVDVVIAGHDHLYERFAKQDPQGRADPMRGIRQFIVGTGGAPIYPPASRRPNSEVLGGDWGVLRLELLADRYQWEFVPVEGGSFRDAGSDSCH